MRDTNRARALYRELSSDRSASRETVQLQAIPYHLWANRGSGAMTVWLRRE